MDEHPIIFSAESVRSILDGTKTQTRRVIKLYPNSFSEKFYEAPIIKSKDSGLFVYWAAKMRSYPVYFEKLPYGHVGDRLWVRETFGVHCAPCALYPKGNIVYRADQEDFQNEGGGSAWKPSIFMPRWASRITLEITGVRVERLQDISEIDARAEGMYKPEFYTTTGERVDSFDDITLRDLFSVKWDEMNKKRGYEWSENPWVWVIEFRKL